MARLSGPVQALGRTKQVRQCHSPPDGAREHIPQDVRGQPSQRQQLMDARVKYAVGPGHRLDAGARPDQLAVPGCRQSDGLDELGAGCRTVRGGHAHQVAPVRPDDEPLGTVALGTDGEHQPEVLPVLFDLGLEQACGNGFFPRIAGASFGPFAGRGFVGSNANRHALVRDVDMYTIESNHDHVHEFADPVVTNLPLCAPKVYLAARGQMVQDDPADEVVHE